MKWPTCDGVSTTPEDYPPEDDMPPAEEPDLPEEPDHPDMPPNEDYPTYPPNGVGIEGECEKHGDCYRPCHKRFLDLNGDCTK